MPLCNKLKIVVNGRQFCDAFGNNAIVRKHDPPYNVTNQNNRRKYDSNW